MVLEQDNQQNLEEKLLETKEEIKGGKYRPLFKDKNIVINITNIRQPKDMIIVPKKIIRLASKRNRIKRQIRAILQSVRAAISKEYFYTRLIVKVVSSGAKIKYPSIKENLIRCITIKQKI